MAWKDWDRTNKVIVSVCTIVAVAVIATFAVIALRPTTAPPEMPPDTPGPATSASPSPTYQCTTATGTDCTKDLAEKEAARDKAYADSENILRTYYDELTKARKAGGVDRKLPKELEKVVAEELQKDVLGGLQAIKAQKVYYTGETKLSSIEPSSLSPEWPMDTIKYDLCVDSRRFNALSSDNDEFIRSGVLVASTVSMDSRSAVWRVTSVESKEVESC